jgi:hypothetical protein
MNRITVSAHGRPRWTPLVSTDAVRIDRRPVQRRSSRPPAPGTGRIVCRLHAPHLQLFVRRSEEAMGPAIHTTVQVGGRADLRPLAVGAGQEPLLRQLLHPSAPAIAFDPLVAHASSNFLAHPVIHQLDYGGKFGAGSLFSRIQRLATRPQGVVQPVKALLAQHQQAGRHVRPC